MTALADISDALAAGQRLGEFEIREVIGAGGFGIVYRAFDHALEREVAIKEYLPASLATRVEGLRISVLSRSRADHFALGLRSFVNEGRLLARFDHPALVKVHRFWEANGTAYMAMALYRGRNLRQLRERVAAAPDEAWLRGLLEPLLGALEALHREEIYHRDIAPDNILVTEQGQPVLLDFGAARRVLADGSHAVTSILKPGFAPVEQYGESTELRQGPWTDLYALGATLHHLVTGAPPAPATARALGNAGAPLAAQAREGLSPALLQIIDWMLEPRPQRRPQSVAQLRAALAGETVPPPRSPAPPSPAAWAPTQHPARAAVAGYTAEGGAVTDAGTVTGGGTVTAAGGVFDPVELAAALPAASSSAASSPAWPRARRPAAIVAALLLSAAAAAWWLGRTPSVAPAEAASLGAPAARQAEGDAAVPQAPRSRSESPVDAAVAAPPKAAPVAPEEAAPPARRRVAGTPGGAAPAPRAAAPGADPREACAGRLLLGLHRCLQRECARPQHRGHAVCEEVRRIDEGNVLPTP